MPYVPPHLRNRGPVRKIKVFAPVEIVRKTKEQMWEEYRLKNYGKADDAFTSVSGSFPEGLPPWNKSDHACRK